MGNSLKQSPLAPKQRQKMPVISGVSLATAATGMRYKGRDDVMLALLAPGTEIAGALTRSATRSAPVEDCAGKLGRPAQNEAAAILVNAGNANAFTGRAGDGSVAAITQAVAEQFSVPLSRVFTSSTGVIGEPLAHDEILAHFGTMASEICHDAGDAAFADAAAAIMTTDTFVKCATRALEIDGQSVQLAGIAKGSGMIAPNMATMLAYIFTDAKVSQSALQDLMAQAVNQSFNAITVDSDTSTSDTVLVAATGASGCDASKEAAFREALCAVMQDLAHQIVRDGEGASKFITVHITGAASAEDARTHAMSVANSPLVKTAIAGEDANWGRVVMAIGKSGAQADRDRLSIWFGDLRVAHEGRRDNAYSEKAASAYMKNDEITVRVDFGLGPYEDRIWTCDLTHRYVEINADYRS